MPGWLVVLWHATGLFDLLNNPGGNKGRGDFESRFIDREREGQGQSHSWKMDPRVDPTTVKVQVSSTE